MNLIKFVMTALATVSISLMAVAGPENESDAGSQAAADVLRQVAGSDAAFLPASAVKEDYDAGNLASILQYPTDELAVVSLKGSQVRQALERSASLYPSPNAGFLQLSGITATLSKNASPDKRIISVLIGGSKLEDGKAYSVAMPSSLARGGLGYFKVWDRSQITKTFEGKTLESFLKGKRIPTDFSPRWTIQ